MDNRRSKVDEFLKLICHQKNSEEFIKEHQQSLQGLKGEDEFQRNLKMHNALSHELRFAIYRLLEKEELCTCALAEIVQMSEPTITHHLKLLSDAGLIIAEKQGLFTVYFTKENFHKKKYDDHHESIQKK